MMNTDPANERAAALKRLNARRDFIGHLVAFVVINAAVVLVWFATGRGYFWPGWVLGGWGIGLVLHAWDTFGRRPISEEDIRREMARGGRGI